MQGQKVAVRPGIEGKVQSKRRAWHRGPTGVAVTETSEERVRPSALAVRVGGQVLGVGVDGQDLHSRSSLHEPSVLSRWGEPKERTPG